MPHSISDDCINCGACDDSCSVNAISEQDGKRVITSEICIDCGACVDICSVDAIQS